MPAMFAIPADPPLGDSGVYTIKTAESFLRGAAVYLDSNEQLVECGADPTAILGFASQDANPEDLWNDEMVIFKATEGQKFWMSGDNAPVAGDVNQSYGIVKDGDGIWTVDGTETSDVRVYVHKIDTTRNLYCVSVLVGYRQAV